MAEEAAVAAGKSRTLVVTLLIIAVVSLFAVGYLLGRATNNPPSPPSDMGSCTMEAKICPDGSAVGREGPDCAFAECPDQPASNNKEE